MGRQVWTGLDGVRAIGVIAVVLYHASLGFSVNGYVGVDIFFALSGFLITWLLVAERERTGRVSISDFYARRGLRLLPALMVTLAMVSFLSIASERPGVILRGALASLLYVSNWWKFTGHDMPLLDHTWTLAIEEHFYLIWPLLVLLGSSRSRARRLPALVLGVALIVVMVLPWAPSVALVKGTYLRGVSILLGSLLAVGMYFRPPVGRTARLLGPLAGLSCVLLVAVTVTWVALPIRWMSGITSVPAWLTLVLVAASVAAPQSRVVRGLSSVPLRWVGRRSYGLYLYHFPVLSLLTHNIDLPIPHAARMALGIGIALVITEVSFRYVETPTLRLKGRFMGEGAAVVESPAKVSGIGANHRTSPLPEAPVAEVTSVIE